MNVASIGKTGWALALKKPLIAQATLTKPVRATSTDVVEQISQLLTAGSEQAENEQAEVRDSTALISSHRQAVALLNSSAYLEKPLVERESLLTLLAETVVMYQRSAASLATSENADIHIGLLLSVGSIYQDKANFGTAIAYYRPGLAIAQTTNRLEDQAILLHNIGTVEAETGQYDLAKSTLADAAKLSEQTDYVALKASAVFTLGWVFELQQNYQEAIAHYQTALDIFKVAQAQYDADGYEATNLYSRQMRVLNNLAVVHLKQADYAAASQSFDEGFTLLATHSDPVERAVLLNSTGSLNVAQGNSAKAWTLYLQALQMSRQVGDSVGEIEVLLNLGQLMEAQKRPEVAIFFYKQAIANIETIRQDLQPLSKSVQQRYTLTIEDFYRNLADLLLQQDRESEALEILDLLKLQEVSTYLNSNQRQGKDSHLNTASEAALLKVLEVLPAETSLADFLAHPATAELTSSVENIPFDLKAIESLRAALAAQPVRTAVLYPLILEDRLEILLITPEGTVERFSTDISQVALEASINDLQSSLRNKAFEAKAPAQKLYSWLIRPLDETLASHQVENIIYLPDGALRYVPLAALHDGQQWLVQKYQSHNITAAALNDLTAPHGSRLSVMAGAFTDPDVTHRVEVGADPFDFPGLSAAKQEIENLSASIPDTVALLDADFTHQETLAAVGDRNILHLATHAKFIPGQPEDSFILFGDGEAVNMRSLREWQLPNVDLVVLSACQTASSIEGEGKEILGLGFQVRKTGAKAVIASLWAVDDNATAALMTQFYQALSTGQTKAQALRHAQIQLIESNSASDPYDWGAFVLIGNGL